jgi:uncharacterized FlaG/YvyC family protein
MQIARMEMVEQAKVEYNSKISKVQEVDEKLKLDPDEKYKENEDMKIQKSNEVILDNVQFGYDKDLGEFFVRIKKGNQEYQYPTEDMFNLKKSLMKAYEELIDK